MMVTPFSTKLLHVSFPSQMAKQWGKGSSQADLDVGDTPFDVDSTQQLDAVDQGYDTSNDGTVGMLARSLPNWTGTILQDTSHENGQHSNFLLERQLQLHDCRDWQNKNKKIQA